MNGLDFLGKTVGTVCFETACAVVGYHNYRDELLVRQGNPKTALGWIV